MDLTIGILSLVLLWVLVVLLFRWNGIELMGGSWMGMVGLEGMTSKKVEKKETEEIQTPDKTVKVVSTM